MMDFHVPDQDPDHSYCEKENRTRRLNLGGNRLEIYFRTLCTDAAGAYLISGGAKRAAVLTRNPSRPWFNYPPPPLSAPHSCLPPIAKSSAHLVYGHRVIEALTQN